MSLSNAMFVGFTGIQSNTVGVDTVGDNLANVNTTGFKSQRTLFETLLYQTVREGEAPSDTSGGTLPYQIGRGSTVSSTQRNFGQGGLDSTGITADLAVDGDGFFILEDATETQSFTRDGSFRLNANQQLTSSAGALVQAFPVDETGAIQTGTLSDLVVPIGSAGEAVETGTVVMDGRLDPNTNLAAAGAVLRSQPLSTSTGGAATATTPLTSIVDADGVPLFADGDSLRIAASKGGVSTTPSTFVVGSTGGTLGDLAQHLEAVLAIQSDPGADPAPGVAVSPDGALIVSSNPGRINAVQLDGASIVNQTGSITGPLAFETTTPAIGEGVTTTFGVFDSLGNLVEVRLRAAMESKADTGTTWRFYAESAGDSDLSPALGTGTITFDPNGQFVAATGTDLSIDRAGVGSATPLAFTLDLSRLTGLASADGSSQLIMDTQDGAPTGILQDYRIEADGTVVGLFSNQQERALGQIALATFVNREGLIAQGENTFASGPNSGDAMIGPAQTGVAGAVISGALEQSNVEIAREFINLISSSTGISSASRVVRAADDLLQELLLLAR